MNIVLLGASGHAKVIIDVLEKVGAHHIVGLIAEDAERACCGYPVLGRLEDLADICREYRVDGAIAAIGDNWSRSEVVHCARQALTTLAFVSAIHPSAQISEKAEIGAGTVVMAGAVVNCGVHVGQHCIVNTRASIDHECVVGQFASIAPGATLGGNVRIGDFSAISLGASVIHGVTVGAHTVVGAGSVVVRDLPSHIVAYGVPARRIRERFQGQRYL